MCVCVQALTEGGGEPLRLVVVHDGHAQRVESHHTQHHPVEALRLHHAADEEAQPLLLAAEVGGGVQLAAALHAGAAKRRAGRSCGGVEGREGGMDGGHFIFEMDLNCCYVNRAADFREKKPLS